MSYHRDRFDWGEFFIYFVIGGMLGAIVGFFIYLFNPDPLPVPVPTWVVYVGGCGLVGALLAGITREGFADILTEKWWWW